MSSEPPDYCIVASGLTGKERKILYDGDFTDKGYLKGERVPLGRASKILGLQGLHYRIAGNQQLHGREGLEGNLARVRGPANSKKAAAIGNVCILTEDVPYSVFNTPKEFGTSPIEPKTSASGSKTIATPIKPKSPVPFPTATKRKHDPEALSTLVEDLERGIREKDLGYLEYAIKRAKRSR